MDLIAGFAIEPSIVVPWRIADTRFDSCHWIRYALTIRHIVFDRFGLKEHVRIAVSEGEPQ